MHRSLNDDVGLQQVCWQRQLPLPAPLRPTSANCLKASSIGVTQVHGNHRSCERGPGGWHRHNRYGERRPCREWRGQGRRPDACVKFGPVWYCDY